MNELYVTWRKDRPVHCSGCGAEFVPKDGKVLGVDDRHEEIWPVTFCPGCGETIAASSEGHAEFLEIRAS